MGAGSASLIDTGSANKTLHNTTPIERPVTLRAGDEIQIGSTGATLKVLALDLTPTPQEQPRQGMRPVALLALGGGLAACLAVVCAVVFWPRRTPVEPPDTPIQPTPVAPVVQNKPAPETKGKPAA